jgi:hypothetical protein
MHSHTAKILTWKLDKDFNYTPGSYGCTDCSETFTEAPSNGSIVVEHTHTSYVAGCFACKVGTLQLNTGDANGTRDMSQKKWDKELDLYRSARKQGIQPEGTTTAKIRKALDVSDKTGYAYGSDL